MESLFSWTTSLAKVLRRVRRETFMCPYSSHLCVANTDYQSTHSLGAVNAIRESGQWWRGQDLAQQKHISTWSWSATARTRQFASVFVGHWGSTNDLWHRSIVMSTVCNFTLSPAPTSINWSIALTAILSIDSMAIDKCSALTARALPISCSLKLGVGDEQAGNTWKVLMARRLPSERGIVLTVVIRVANKHAN